MKYRADNIFIFCCSGISFVRMYKESTGVGLNALAANLNASPTIGFNIFRVALEAEKYIFHL